jgi:hypothetical protein
MRAAGAVVGVAAGLDEALAGLEQHGLLLGTAAGAPLGRPPARVPAPRCPGAGNPFQRTGGLGCESEESIRAGGANGSV